ncbi:hypothetical protein ACFU9B_44750 [Streptomyces sp. NPDC057592]|uniref:hypothetical protein n=1 Tax=unclassified Streptomyces TaxID=2593676 RepID=UPI0036ACE284
MQPEPHDVNRQGRPHPGEATLKTLILSPAWIVTLLWAIFCLFKLAENTHQRSRHRSALPNRSPWSLHVGPGGITTTDNFRRTIPWEQVKTVTTEIINAPEWYAYPGLHVRFVKHANVTPLRPAGWFYPGGAPDGTDGRVPVCVLGPLTEHQHFELTEALTRHAGARWRPKLGHKGGNPTVTS